MKSTSYECMGMVLSIFMRRMKAQLYVEEVLMYFGFLLFYENTKKHNLETNEISIN